MKVRKSRILQGGFFAFLFLTVNSMAFVMTQEISLDGEWDFIVDSTKSYTIESVGREESWRTAKVPLSWQAQFSDLRDYQGVAWYRKTVRLGTIKNGSAAILRFGAVDYLATVYVNSKLAGSHEGGYTPFQFDVSSLLKEGDNQIVVRVMDPIESELGTEGISLWHVPRGKQSWYVQTSGLWQSVSLRIRPKRHIVRALINPRLDGHIEVMVSLSAQASGQNRRPLRIRITDPNGKEVYRSEEKIVSHEGRIRARVSQPRLWSPDHPNLYRLSLVLGEDEHNETFGFRSIETRGGFILLNGEPIYLIGALDQDFYPETIYTPPSKTYLRDQMAKAKRMGLNLLRCHIKVPDPRYLEAADEAGVLIWGEIPNWDKFTFDAARRGSQTMDAMLERDWNHPSLVILSIINESWGIDLSKSEQRQWLKTEYDRLKVKAKGRLVVDNSACWGNFHLKSDINDYHTYWAIPENCRKFAETVEAVDKRPTWLFSPHGDAEATGSEPLMVSEFGNWGLPKLPQELPWWFSRDFLGREVTLPEGVYERFGNYEYDKIFNEYSSLAAESQFGQFEALKWEIEEIRLRSGIQGYVITEFTDINWECNGLLDMWRNPKVASELLKDIQQQDVVIVRPSRWSAWEGDSISFTISLSHYSSRSLNGSRIVWQASHGAPSEIPVKQIRHPDVVTAGVFTINAGNLQHAGKLRVDVRLERDTVLAKNFCEISVVPRLPTEKLPSLRWYDPLKKMSLEKQYLESQGYRLDAPNSDSPILTATLDYKLLEELKKGATVLCFVGQETKMPERFPVNVTLRESEWYDGNWASNFNWARNYSPLFKPLNMKKRFGFELAGAVPKLVLTGIPSEHFRDVLAGMFVGWLHLNSAYIVQMNVAKGKLLLCTIPILQSARHDAFSARLLHDMIEYVSSGAMKPDFTWHTGVVEELKP